MRAQAWSLRDAKPHARGNSTRKKSVIAWKHVNKQDECSRRCLLPTSIELRVRSRSTQVDRREGAVASFKLQGRTLASKRGCITSMIYMKVLIAQRLTGAMRAKAAVFERL